MGSAASSAARAKYIEDKEVVVNVRPAPVGGLHHQPSTGEMHAPSAALLPALTPQKERGEGQALVERPDGNWGALFATVADGMTGHHDGHGSPQAPACGCAADGASGALKASLARSGSGIVAQPCVEEEKVPEPTYARVTIEEPDEASFDIEEVNAARKLLSCLEIRKKYVGSRAGPSVEPSTTWYAEKAPEKQARAGLIAQIDAESGLALAEGGNRRILWDPFCGSPPAAAPGLKLAFKEGVHVACQASGAPVDEFALVGIAEFCQDYVHLLQVMRDRSCISFCGPRLHELELRFQLHTHRNAGREAQRQRQRGGRDWYQVRKVDTHIHHSAAFTQHQLMHFIRTKLKEEADTVVGEEDGKPVTLRDVFSSAGVEDEDDVNGDRLCTLASIGNGQHDTFGRFDVFNNKYNPFGDKRLREIFLKTDNFIDGRFLAELTQEVMQVHSKQKFICAEWRISIYGKSRDEWAKLAKWFRTHNIQCQQIRWLIQVPRLYPIFKKLGQVNNFAETLQNIFEPLFEASMDPSAHEDIFYMMQQVVGFDSVDDESQGTHLTLKDYPLPEDWNFDTNPPYTYWMYYMYANIRSLNALRRKQGMNTLTFRPHCGEAGNVSHLCSGFMLADGINHGVQLRETPVLQYLFYLAQVGIAVSPLSNDILFIPLEQSPFGTFFKRGLNVSLSTDDPLIIHLTEEALVEEYVVAARSFRLSNTDLCEIARNSVLQSGFEKIFKEWWIGSDGAGADGNDEKKSNVPQMRLLFRCDCLRQEMDNLRRASGASK